MLISSSCNDVLPQDYSIILGIHYLYSSSACRPRSELRPVMLVCAHGGNQALLQLLCSLKSDPHVLAAENADHFQMDLEKNL